MGKIAIPYMPRFPFVTAIRGLSRLRSYCPTPGVRGQDIKRQPIVEEGVTFEIVIWSTQSTLILLVILPCSVTLRYSAMYLCKTKTADKFLSLKAKTVQKQNLNWKLEQSGCSDTWGKDLLWGRGLLSHVSVDAQTSGVRIYCGGGGYSRHHCQLVTSRNITYWLRICWESKRQLNL